MDTHEMFMYTYSVIYEFYQKKKKSKCFLQKITSNYLFSHTFFIHSILAFELWGETFEDDSLLMQCIDIHVVAEVSIEHCQDFKVTPRVIEVGYYIINSLGMNPATVCCSLKFCWGVQLLIVWWWNCLHNRQSRELLLCFVSLNGLAQSGIHWLVRVAIFNLWVRKLK